MPEAVKGSFPFLQGGGKNVFWTLEGAAEEVKGRAKSFCVSVGYTLGSTLRLKL